MTSVQSPIIPVVADWIRMRPGTISLGQGTVGYGPPPQAIDEVQRFLAGGAHHKYSAVDGLPELRSLLEAKLTRENGLLPLGDRQVMVTAGGNMAFMNSVLAITDPGDEIILQKPYYFNHEMAVTMAGCHPRLVDTDGCYQLRPDAIRKAITPRTKAVVTISPNNPTGAVYPAAALAEVNRTCAENGIYHVHDEAYEYFTYPEAKLPAHGGADGKPGSLHVSPASFARTEPHTISLFSLSKAYGFASWRIGYMVVPAQLSESLKKIQDTILICPPVISQFAAIGALRAGRDYCHAHLGMIASLRRTVLEELQALRPAVEIPLAQGAFYFLLRVQTHLSSLELAERLVREHGVAVIPGVAFGMKDGCYLRIAYAALEPSTVREGLGRLCRGLKAVIQSH